MPFLLLAVAFPLSIAAIVCALVAAESDGPRGRAALGLGRVAWFSLAALAAWLAWGVHPRWEPVLASVHLPLLGLFASSGLVTGGSAACVARGRAGWTLPLALAAIAALGLLPLYLFEVVGDPDPPPRATGEPLAALVETARYGFGGPVPALMRPEVPSQVERGLGSPPREVTVPMGSTGVAAAAITWIAALVLLARGPVPAAFRGSLLAIGPLALLLASLLVPRMGLTPGDALWQNDPQLVRAYGPWLLAAAVSVALLLALGLLQNIGRWRSAARPAR